MDKANGKSNNRSIAASFKKRFFQQFPVNTHTLSNGLKIITQENRRLPIASMYTIFRVGSRNERPGITGISHLFEHMMFNGSKKFGPKEFDLILESGGGYSNAYTSHDLTVYYEDFDSSLLETVLDLESDRMGWLDLSDKNLKSERCVVTEERRLRTDDSIFGRLEEELYAASYQSHPYRWPIIGWMSDIQNISVEDCQRYFQHYYVPNNATIILSGDFDTNSAVKLFEKYYNRISKGDVPADPTTTEPPQKGEKRIKYKKESGLENFVVGYHVPEIGSKDLVVFDLIQVLLTDGESSLLHKLMVRDKALALYVSSDFTWQINPGIFVFSVQMKPGKTFLQGEKLLESELVRLGKELIPEDALQRAKNILESDFISTLQTNSGRAHRLGLSEVMLGSYKTIFDPIIVYSKITVEDIRRVIAEYFVQDNKTIVWLE